MSGILEGKFIAKGSIMEDKLSQDVIKKLNDETPTIEVVQETGTNTGVVMSQKAVTDALKAKANTTDIPTDYVTTGNLSSSLNNYVPTTRTVNGKPLNANITLSASDVGAAKTSDIPTDYVTTGNLSSSLSNYVPTTRTVNGKPLSANITLSATDVGAAKTSDIPNVPTVVQTIGESTSDVMSQKAVSSALFNDPATAYQIQIGKNASATGNYSVAIGNNANASTNNGIAIGYNSQVRSEDIQTGDSFGIVSVGTSASSGFYRRIINVANGVNMQDALPLGQLRGSILNTYNRQLNNGITYYTRLTTNIAMYFSNNLVLRKTSGTSASIYYIWNCVGTGFDVAESTPSATPFAYYTSGSFTSSDSSGTEKSMDYSATINPDSIFEGTLQINDNSQRYIFRVIGHIGSSGSSASIYGSYYTVLRLYSTSNPTSVPIV